MGNLKHMPGVRYAREKYAWLKLRMKSTERVFSDIFRTNTWGGKDSASGPGSDLVQTRVVVSALPGVFRDFDIKTMLDIPCGDFYWMKSVNLEGVRYTGADIVSDLIHRNKEYETSTINFCKLNLLKDNLPRVDLVFCRDCLVHLSNKDIFSALNTIHRSGSTYLLTTTHVEFQRNYNIATGEWRPLNLEAAPFAFPPPIQLINEQCSVLNGALKDKSLGLWKIATIGECLAKHHD